MGQRTRDETGHVQERLRRDAVGSVERERLDARLDGMLRTATAKRPMAPSRSHGGSAAIELRRIEVAVVDVLCMSRQVAQRRHLRAALRFGTTSDVPGARHRLREARVAVGEVRRTPTFASIRARAGRPCPRRLNANDGDVDRVVRMSSGE